MDTRTWKWSQPARPALLGVFLAMQLMEEVFLNAGMLKNECDPPPAELGVEAGGALAAALLAISLVCLNIFLVITERLLESVRAYCLKPSLS